MDLVAPKKDLVAVLSRAATIAERKGTMPILSCVHLTAEGDGLRVAATDLYLAIRGSVAAEVKKSGTAVVSCKDLLERVRMMPDGPIQISTKDEAVSLKSVGRARRYTLRGLKADDYPPIPEVEEGKPTMTLPAGVLAGLIARTAHAISTDETRAHLNGACFQWDGATVRMVGTDGHQLAKVETKVETKASVTMLIPLKAIREVARLCDGAEAAADVAFVQQGPNAIFTVGGVTLVVRLTDSQFPPFDQVIPQDGRSHRFRVRRAAIADAIRAISVASSDRTDGVTLALDGKTLRIEAKSADGGEGSDEVPVEYDGAPFRIMAKASYLLPNLEATGGEEVEVDMGGDLDPIAMRSEQFVGIVMPMRDV